MQGNAEKLKNSINSKKFRLVVHFVENGKLNKKIKK
jgi:hypothetical protein